MIKVFLFIVISTIIMYFISLRYYSYAGLNKNVKKDMSNNKIFIFWCFGELTIISGLRGDFTHDYKNYADVFHYIGKQSFTDIILNRNDNHTELLYNLINKAIYILTKNEVILFVCISALTVFFFMKAFQKLSDVLWLTVILFVTSGLFFLSFNLVRVCLASGMVFWGINYLKEDRPIKYLLVILVTCFIHKTAIIGIVFFVIYFIKVRKYVYKPISLIAFLAMGGFYVVLRPLISFALQFVYTEYAKEDAYGIMGGLPITSMAVPILICINLIALWKNINYNNKMEKIYFGGTLIYLMISICCLRVEMLQWFLVYFTPLAIVYICNLMSREQGKKKLIYIGANVLVFLIYSLLSSVAKWDYHLFWQ